MTTTTTTTTAKTLEGWHTVYGVQMHTDERGYIDRAIWEYLGERRPAYVYRKCPSGGWDRDDTCTIAAFRAGRARGTIIYR